MAVNPNSLEYQYRRVAGGDNNNQKATYAVEFSSGGQNYTFIPDSVIGQGVQAGDKQYVMPWFLNQDNLGKLGDVGQRVDLNGVSWYGDYFKDTVGASPTGFLIPSGTLNFDSDIKSPPLDKGRVQGVANTREGLAYVMDTPSGTLGRYIASDGKTTTLTQTGGSSLLGGVVGGWFDDLTKATGIQDVANDVNAFFQTPVGKAMLVASAAAAGGAFDGVGTAGGAPVSAGATGGSGAAAAGAGAGTAGATSGGLMTNAALDAQFIAADAAQLSAQGLSSAQIAQTLTASGVDSFIAADAAQLAAQGLGASQIASTLGAAAPTSTAATGAGGLFTNTGATAAAGGAAAGAAGGALTASEMAKLGLVSGGMNLLGGVLQGETSKDALNQLAAQQAALAEKTMQMGKFQPVGVTTRFGTSNFVTDPVTGAITPSYTLSPEAKAYQDALAGMATQGLTAGQGLMNLGQGYIGESPEAVRNRYIQTQQALLAPQQEQTLAALRARQQATGRGGLAVGATSDGMMATNPEMAAYYNSLAQTQRQLAANAETQYQNQVNFGTGLLNQATTPFANVFGAQKGVELAAQQPLELSTNFANTVATRGAAQGANYAQAMAPSLQAQYNANNYNPYATALQGAGNNPLTGYGLMKLTGLA